MTNHPDQRELEPCPFCGCKADLVSSRDGVMGLDWHWAVCRHVINPHRGSRAATKAEAIAAWNRRPTTTDAEVREMVERDIPSADAVEDVARLFHDTYEKMAPGFGYVTREETRVFDPESSNGRLMIAVCEQVITAYRPHIEAEKAEAVKALTFIADTIAANISETDKEHAMIVGDERFTGPAVDKAYNILMGLERIARQAIRSGEGG